MAYPYQIRSGNIAAIGPFENGSDLFVALIRVDINPYAVAIYKSTDAGQTWSEADAGNHKQTASNAGYDSYLDALQHGTKIYVLYRYNGGANAVGIASFEMSTSTWDTSLVATGGPVVTSTAFFWVGRMAPFRFARLSNGDFRVAYMDQHTSGSTYGDVKLSTFNGSTWSSAEYLFGSATYDLEEQWIQGFFTDGDRAYALAVDSIFGIQMRVIRADDSISDPIYIAPAAFSNNTPAIGIPCVYTEGGQECFAIPIVQYSLTTTYEGSGVSGFTNSIRVNLLVLRGKCGDDPVIRCDHVGIGDFAVDPADPSHNQSDGGNTYPDSNRTTSVYAQATCLHDGTALHVFWAGLYDGADYPLYHASNRGCWWSTPTAIHTQASRILNAHGGPIAAGVGLIFQNIATGGPYYWQAALPSVTAESCAGSSRNRYRVN